MLPLFAGTIASLIYIVSAIPALTKLYRTRSVDSYSRASLWMLNVGNVLQWLYVLSLPVGPLYALHAWSTLSTALLLIWCHQYRTPAL